MSFFGGKLWKTIQKVAPVAAAFVLSGGNPLITAAAAGAGTAVRGGNVGQILTSAGYGYGAGSLANAGAAAYGASGGNLAAGASGPVTSGMGTAQVAGNAFMSAASPISKVLGAVNSASSLMGSGSQKQAVAQQKISNPTLPTETAGAGAPQRPEAISAPGTLSELSAYSPEQTRSALATQGVNGGLGADEQAYYRNLIQRSLIGDGNKINTTNPNFLLPIESQYFSQQGRNTSDVIKFLKSFQG